MTQKGIIASVVETNQTMYEALDFLLKMIKMNDIFASDEFTGDEQRAIKGAAERLTKILTKAQTRILEEL